MKHSSYTGPENLSIDRLQAALLEQAYVADRSLAVSLYLAVALGKPILLEGPAGVGKTEVAKALAAVFGTTLIRLQCYEGLDVHTALYEWNYPKQLLRIKLEEGERAKAHLREREAAIFSEEYLLERPLLQALRQPDSSPVLLIDELDRADVEFEAFLLEILSEFQVTIPELGTLRARHRPHVVITSNRTRDLSDAVRRRCLYAWIDYPGFEKELAIIQARLPGIDEALSEAVADFARQVRALDLDKPPGTGETLDWARALLLLDGQLNRQAVDDTLGLLAKTDQDLQQLRKAMANGHLAVPGLGSRKGENREAGV